LATPGETEDSVRMRQNLVALSYDIQQHNSLSG
jgi:hypothetical protein